MRRKEKRLLQGVALVLAALVLLPNVGLWALYRERQPDGTPGGSGAAAAAAAGQVSPQLPWSWEHALLYFPSSLRLVPSFAVRCLLRVSARDSSVLPIVLDGKIEAQRRAGIVPVTQKPNQNYKPGLLMPTGHHPLFCSISHLFQDLSLLEDPVCIPVSQIFSAPRPPPADPSVSYSSQPLSCLLMCPKRPLDLLPLHSIHPPSLLSFPDPVDSLEDAKIMLSLELQALEDGGV